MVALLKTAHCCLNPLGSLDAWPDRYFVLGALLLRMMPLIHLVWLRVTSQFLMLIVHTSLVPFALLTAHPLKVRE